MFTFGSDPEATVLVSLTPIEAIRLLVLVKEACEKHESESDIEQFLLYQDLALKVALAKTASPRKSA